MSDQPYYNLDGWAQIPCNVSEWMVQHSEGLMKVYSTITDPDGMYGRPLVYTEWGSTEGDQAVLRNYRWPDSERPCEHWVNTKENAEKAGEDDDLPHHL